MPYIKVLSENPGVQSVVVVSPRINYEERAAMGWQEKADENASDKLTVSISPSPEEVERFLTRPAKSDGNDADETSSVICFFSGITAFPEVHAWFLQSLKHDVRRAIITEAPYVYDHPLWQHRIRFLLKDWRFVPKIDWVFAIGEDCVNYYRSWSSRWQVVPFLYCTAVPTQSITDSFRTDSERIPIRVAFVGSLDRRKNVSLLIDAMLRLEKDGCNFLLTIIGDGPLRRQLEQQAESLVKLGKARFMGALPMDQVQQMLTTQDLLSLPSLHDGWGAVVNEAMLQGVVPVCSDHCGARQLIKESGFGGIHGADDVAGLASQIRRQMEALQQLRDARECRREWALSNISPEAVANRMLRALSI